MSAASVPTPSHGLSRETRIVVTSDHVSADLEGETVILSMTDGVYYGLDRVGARIWHALATPTALADVLQVILDEFEVEEARAWADLEQLIGDLLRHRLVVRVDDERP